MKTLTTLLYLVLCLPFALSAQSIEVILPKVSASLSAGKNNEAASLFGKALDVNPEKAEMFYWVKVDKNSGNNLLFAEKLATYYHKSRNYEKAYLFYRELLQINPNSVAYLTGYAETEVCRGHEDKALKTYEKILSMDEYNLAANIFVGNYLYLKAEGERRILDADFKKITAPTRMQHARYREGLSNILADKYNKAKTYLQIVVQYFPSTEVQKTLNKIQKIEKEINR